MIRENEGWNNWSMIEIEKYPCNDKNEACARERYWYELLNANTTEGKYALEIWKYKPLNIVSDNTVVDPLSLYLSMQDIKDERIEMALDQMLKKYVW